VVEQTALAEAELEYHDKTSDAIFVKFPIVRCDDENLRGAFAIIWTTTPWTIPANKAIAYDPESTYSIIIANGEKYIIAKELIKNFLKDACIEEFETAMDIIGENLQGIVCHHPLRILGFSHEVPMLPAWYVTMDVGTGLVHTAPAHGLEDFMLGKKYDLSVEDIVNDDGTLVDSLPYFQGEHVFKVNPKIIGELKKAGNLIHAYQITHSYPHSWRSKAPLIYRTTTQWFIAIDGIRDKLLKEIDKTTWIPANYVNRIRSMVEKRPDWCISRQRIWGIPVALFVNKNTNEVLVDDEVFNNVIQTFRNEGIESWYTKPIEYFLGKKYDPRDFNKVSDTLEVWFDSACSHHYVLEKRDDLKWPADLYFEGSDQHRGWFQSSLVESVCTTGIAPYKQVATNGFVLDKNGRKMSKSLGNVVSPGDVVNKMGADVLRLWCLNSDYSEDLRIGEEILRRQQDVYRRFRNTLRYLLGVISDYDPDKKVSYDALPGLEKLILCKLYGLNKLMKKCIKQYNFKVFFTELHAFCTNDLSAFYFDIRKDTIYCDAKASLKRLSCLTVMNELFICISHWLAPALSFTSEEAWKHYELNTIKSSIHINLFPEVPEIWNNNNVVTEWKLIHEVRKTATEALEVERAAKTIGSSLEANVFIYSNNLEKTRIVSNVDFDEVAIVSGTSVVNAQPPSNATINENIGIGVVIKKASGTKCDRCWKISKNVTFCETTHGTANLCQRCLNVVVSS
ncbi:MAG: isoleucine--tRNA ligase, partial [Holosporales bacterium]|nr:isoleucine--tRNA ligase [Holosporales bacterium]